MVVKNKTTKPEKGTCLKMAAYYLKH